MEDRKKETDFYERVTNFITKKDVITFKNNPRIYEVPGYDWYITVALEKADKVSEDRHLLTSDLLMEYRWAIREGYQHGLDPSLKNRYDYPNNRNTIKGIQSYIDRITKASDEEMQNISDHQDG